MKYNKKLIEVALPLEAINIASAREKSIRQGHPSTLHLWWARRPLAAARAVIFAQMVDDPSSYVSTLKSNPKLKNKAELSLKARIKVWEESRILAEKSRGTAMPAADPGLKPNLDETIADIERERLFSIIRELVTWENISNEKVLQSARDEILQSWRRSCAENADHPRAKEIFNRHVLPAFHDPFAGGGSLPLEAQRLGLESYASDLNPVAVMINKAMIEMPSLFAGKFPVNPSWQLMSKDQQAMSTNWTGARGLADDVQYYGHWMREQAEKRIGQLFPKIKITDEIVIERPDLKKYLGRELTIIAWLWARTVRSPNPAFSNVDVPLVSTFIISPKKGKEAYVEPIINGSKYHFTVKAGIPTDPVKSKNGTKVGRGGNFKCLLSGTPIPVATIREQGLAGTLGSKLMAIVVDGDRERIFLSPSPDQESLALSAKPSWYPDQEINYNPRDIRTQLYGLTKYGDLFSKRQLVALTTFADLISEVRQKIKADAIVANLPNDEIPISKGGSGALAYADAVGMYLGLGVGRCANYWSSLTPWGGDFIVQTFGRQAIPMVWDYAEGNPFSSSTGNWTGAIDWITKVIVNALSGHSLAHAVQFDAQTQTLSLDKVISTDPPYYDNIGYADLSDYFYIWLRRSMKSVFPELFSTMTVPKAEELVATRYRHGSKEKAESFFLDGMTLAMHQLANQTHPAFPVTIYYAFKQAESDGEEGTTNTGWDTFLEAIISAGFAITGTWPLRTERDQGLKTGSNFLASSILLVCRQKSPIAKTATRREFVSALKNELPSALALLQAGNIAPVDLAQAAIGPGMAIYTRYLKVLDAEGHHLSVRSALALINQILDECLAEQEGDFDADTRWALTWFDQMGFSEGEFGVAEQLSKSKNTSIEGLVQAEILVSKNGKVKLLTPSELNSSWNPSDDGRLTVWELVHQLIRILESEGESAASIVVGKIGAKAEIARELCYRLYSLSERKKRSADAMSYNGLVQSWPEINRLASGANGASASRTTDLFEQE